MPFLLLNAGSNSNHQLSECEEDIAEFKFASTFESPCEVSTGGNHTLVLHNRSAYGVGLNSANQLGLRGHTINTLTRLDWLASSYPDHHPSLILASWSTSFFLLESPTQPPLFISIGDPEFGVRGVEGAASAPTAVQLPLHDHDLIHAASSFRHIILILKHHTSNTYRVFGWGASRKGQLSAAHAMLPNLSTPHLLLTTHTPLLRVRTGRDHTVIQSAEGLICWGSNAHGQLNLADFPRVCDYGCTWRGTVIYDGKRLWSVGRTGASPNTNKSTEPQLITDTLPIKQLAVGSEHTLILTTDHTVWAFGWNEHGNLGLGHTSDIHSPVCTNISASHMHAGNATSFIITFTKNT